MEAGESSVSNTSEMDGWTLIRDHSDDESEDQQITNKTSISAKSTKSLKLTGAAKRKFSKKRSAICPTLPFNYHVTVEPEISGHDTIIRITKLCDDAPTEAPTESKYFEIDDDGDEIIYLSDSPPPVQKPVKQKKKRCRKRKVNLETIHEHDSPPSRTLPGDHGDRPESDDDIVILPKQNKRRKLEKSPRLEKNEDGRPGEANDVIVPKKTKNRKVIKLTHVPREGKKDDKSGDQRESAESEDDVIMLPKETKEETLEKPFLASGKWGDGSVDDELVIIPKRTKRRKSKENETNRIVAMDNFDMSAPSWTVTVELDDDDNYKVVNKDGKPDETSTSPDVITRAANTLLKISENSPKVIVIQPPVSKHEPGLSDSQSSTEKVEEDNVSVESVEGEENNTDVVETKVIKSENGKRTKTMCVCPCGMMFSHRSGLSRHRRIVHLGMTYRCQMCGEHFTRSDSLNDHIRRLEHWNQQINNLLSPSSTPKRGMYKEFESQGDRQKPGKKKSIINYEIVKKILSDGTQKATLVEKSSSSLNDSDSKCDDVQPEKESDSSDTPFGEKTESPETVLVDSEVSDNGETEVPEGRIVSPKVGDSDEEASSPTVGKGHADPGDEQADHQVKSDNLESPATSKVSESYMKEPSPSLVESSPAVVSLAAKLLQMGTRKLTLSSSIEDKSEKIKPRTLIKEVLCSPQTELPQSIQTETDLAEQQCLTTVVQKNTENAGGEVHKDTIVVDVSAPIVSNFKDNPEVLQPTEGLSEKNVESKQRIIMWPTTTEMTNFWKTHPSLAKVKHPEHLKDVLPATPLALPLPSMLKTQSSTAGSASPTALSQQSTGRPVTQSLSVLKQITSSMSGARLPGVWTVPLGASASASQSVTRMPTSTTAISQMLSSKTYVSVQPASLKPNTTQMLIQSSAPKALVQSVKTEMSPRVSPPTEPMVPSVSYTVVQSSVPAAQSSVPGAQSVLPTVQCSVPAAQASSNPATQSSPTTNVFTQPILSSTLGAPLLLTSAQPAPTVLEPPPLSQTPVTLSSPPFNQTIQTLITTPGDALASSPLPTNPTHALMETLLQSLMHAPIRTMSQPAAEACTSAEIEASAEIEVPAAEAGSKETTQEVMLLFADALSDK